MAKDVRESKDLNIAGAVPAKPVPTRISSEDEAKAWVNQSGYAIPQGCKTIYVTEDRNVFWQDSADAAFNHAFKNNLKLFTLNEWSK